MIWLSSRFLCFLDLRKAVLEARSRAWTLRLITRVFIMLFYFYLCVLLISGRVNFCYMKDLGVQNLLLVFVPMQWACSFLIMLQSALLLLLLLLGFNCWLIVRILFASFAKKNLYLTGYLDPDRLNCGKWSFDEVKRWLIQKTIDEEVKKTCRVWLLWLLQQVLFNRTTIRQCLESEMCHKLIWVWRTKVMNRLEVYEHQILAFGKSWMKN